MKMRLLLSLVFAALLASAQNSNTIFQKIFSNQVTTGVSATVRNTGAQFQQLSAILSDATTPGACIGGGTSGSAQWDLHLEASFDGNTNWFTIGPVMKVLQTSTTLYMSTQGAFPYIRANFAINPSGGACAVTAYYGGSINGYPTSSAPASSRNDNFTYNSAALTAGVNGLVASCSGTNAGSPAIYELIIANLDTLPLTIQVGDVNSGSVTTKMTMTIPSGMLPYTLLHTVRPHFFNAGAYRVGNQAVPFGINVTTASPNAWYYVGYRCE